MLELSYALNLIIKSLETPMKEYGLKLDYPEGVRPPEVPVFTEGKNKYVIYRGEKGRVKIEYCDGKLALYCDTDDSELPDDEMPRISLTLLELNTYDERDLRYIFDEYAETLEEYFGTKKVKKDKSKLPTPVSKSAAKTGALCYDPFTLGNRITGIYPELKEEYRKNIEKYDEFLAEDFFEEYADKLIMATIRENSRVPMRKLFNTLNEVYEDGTNETQSLIAVSILGQMYKEPKLLDNAKAYMSETMEGPVTEVVKYLSSSKSKGARIRLKNPPPYKPPKKKRENPLMKLMGMQQQ